MGDQDRFKVIIAGGGIVGLTLANALERAGIDYNLFEKRDIAPDLGASIGILCHNLRVYEQLGVAAKICEATVPLLDRLHFNEDGYQFEDGGVLKGVKDKTNRPFRFMERRLHLQSLFDNLRDKSKVHAHVGVQSFVENENGITVFADDGDTYEGSMLIGADGVHSTVRRQMAEAAAASLNHTRAGELMSPFTASYRAIFSTSRNISSNTGKPFLPDGTIHVLYHEGVSGVAATGAEGLVFWFLFARNDEVSRTPDCPVYSEDDMEEMIQHFGHLEHGRGYTFHDLWNSRIKAAMFPMEEGTVPGPWNNGGRVVLMGDAVSKATINAGMGGNAHVEGICHLMNVMTELLDRSPVPSKEEITHMFREYERRQRARAESIVPLSSFVTRYEAMETWWMRLLMPVMRRLPDGLMSTLLARYFAAGPLLNFLPRPDED